MSATLKSLVAACVLLCAVQSFAALGDDVSSVDADRAHLNASVRVLTSQRYSIHEMQVPTGATLRQYVSPAGRVFAVSWQGFAPDLQQLLGEHFNDYMAAASQVLRRGRGVHVETGDLVLDSGGHMRYVVGRAFLRSQLPSGVSSDELR
jgi:hypothetical protein